MERHNNLRTKKKQWKVNFQSVFRTGKATSHLENLYQKNVPVKLQKTENFKISIF